MKRNRKSLPIFQRNLLFLFVLLFPVAPVCGAILIDHTSTGLSAIPTQWINKAKADLHIAYNHTSHGSQLITGINALENFPDFGSLYSWQDTSHGDNSSLSLDDHGIPGKNDLSGGDQDTDGDGIDDWAEDTYDFLVNTNNYHINVILWSWCNINEHNIPRYLDSMEWLIAQFGPGGTDPRATEHPVQFVFMTAHANGHGEGDSSDSRNKLIRQHCASHDRILFDFSDMENFDPDNNYYLDKNLTDALYYDKNGHHNANWAVEYIDRHNGSELDRLTTGENVSGYSGCGGCAHSDGPGNLARLNCILKGRATWNLFARIAGWGGAGADTDPPVRTDGNPSDMLPAGTTQATLSIHTDENATCKYATGQNTDYDGMPNIFSGAGSTSHSALITGLQDGTDYTYYVRCLDGAGNENDNDFTISFRVGGIIAMEPLLHLMLKDN
jgi:hypothetical protein